MGCTIGCKSQRDATCCSIPSISRSVTPDDGLGLPPIEPEDLKKLRIVIVGGGPSGLDMARRLKLLHCKSVTVLEKGPPASYGKTDTQFLPETGDTPHEMGTCYLSWSYETVRQLVTEYLGREGLMPPGEDRHEGISIVSPFTDKQKRTDPKTYSSDEWLYAHCEAMKLPMLARVWDFLPDRLQAVPFLVDVNRYRRVHESILGQYEYHGLPPKPSPDALLQLTKTFRELMVENDLKSILDLSCVGFGSYGLGYNVPALYGLWFITPVAVESYIASKLIDDVETIEIMKNGFSTLWKAIIERENIDVKYNTTVQSINRNLDDYSKPIVVKSNAGEVECDLLVFAAPMCSAFEQVVQDTTEFEKCVCRSLRTKGLVVGLFETAGKDSHATNHGERALTFYADSLMAERTPDPAKSKAVYAERNSVRATRPERVASRIDEKRYTVTYQHLPAFESDPSEALRKAVEHITDPVLTVEPTPAEPVPVLRCHRNWEYFPHFCNEGIQALLPWKIFQKQGKWRTWYIGSSVSFESIEDVVRYNEQVLLSRVPSAFHPEKYKNLLEQQVGR